MVNRRGALGTLGAVAALLFLPKAAAAAVSRALSVRELTRASRCVCLGEPVEAYSQWETVGKRRRIVTFTRVLVSEGVLGEPEQELLVQTLGGRVGEIGQIVHGEAALKLHEPSLLFLQNSNEGITRVTAMAQGHYRVLPDERGAARLLTSPQLATLLPSKNVAAVQELKGRTFPEARNIILRANAQ
jgi:hypothetical protein